MASSESTKPPRRNRPKHHVGGGGGGSTPTVKTERCGMFKRGNCRFGERCRYLHSAPQAATTRSTAAVPNVNNDTSAARGPNTAPAKKAQHPKAQTLHETNPRGVPLNMPDATIQRTSTVSALEQTGGPSPSSQPTEPCIAWQNGLCLKWNSCPYSHGAKIEVTSSQSPATTVQTQILNPEPSDSLPSTATQSWIAPPSRGQRGVTEAKGVTEQLNALRKEDELRRQEDERRRLENEHRREEQEWLEQERLEGLRAAREQQAAEARRLALQRAVEERERLRKEEERMARERQKKEKEERLVRERQREQEEKRARDAQFTLQTLVKESNLVTFGPGLDIKRLIPGFGLCKITIRDLPADATRREILDLFHEQGMDDTMFKLVRCRKEANAQVAEFLMQTEGAQAMAVGLEGLEFRNNLLAFEVGANASWGSMSSAAQTNDAMKLTIIWSKPSATMIATYDTMEVTKQKARELDRRFLRGRHISANLNTRPNGPAARYWVETSVRLGNLDPGTTLDEIQTIAGTYNVRSVKSNVYDLDTLVEAMRRSTETERCIAGSFKTESIDANRIKAFARFSSREEMEKAAQRLERSLIAHGPKLRVILPAVHHYTINIPILQYRAQKTQWDAMAEAARGQNAFVRINERKSGLVFINVEGSEQKKVGPLKVRVEGLAAGERLDGDHWHSTFRHGMALFQRVKQETGVLVSVDGRFHAVRLFGSSGDMSAAKQIIRQEVERLSLMEWEIPIARKSVRFLVATGLQILKDSLGDDNVTLDVASQQCKLKLRGGDDAIQHARKLVEEAVAASNVGLPLGNETAEAGAVCPICYDDATHPEILVCGHSCCEPCLRHYLTSAVGSNNFPLVCMGNDATCNTPISIPVIQRYLTEQRFNHLIDAVFDSHIQSNGRKFKYCTTPDCTQIYQCDTDQQVHQCPSCFSKICSSCDKEAHEGMTCEERRIQDDPAEQDRLNDEWARSNNIKRCPSCKVLTEKTEGCNHMECRCGAHFCWICMGVFAANQIYPHMTAAHGGFYAAEPAVPAAGQPQIIAGRAPVLNEQDQWHRQWDALVRDERLAAQRREEQDRIRRLAEQERLRLIAEARRRQDEIDRQRTLRWQREAEYAATVARREAEERRRRAQESKGGFCVIM